MTRELVVTFMTSAAALALAGITGCNSEPKGDVPVVELPDPTPPEPKQEDTSTQQEKLDARVAKFRELDTNRDGQLTLLEFSVGRGADEAARWFQRRDIDGNGLTSLAEYKPLLPLSMTNSGPADEVVKALNDGQK